MNSRQKEVQQVHLDEEKKVIRRLQRVYKKAAEDCSSKIAELASRTDMQNLQSIIYQKQYQQALKKQIDGILDTLQSGSFDSIAEYLTVSYENGYVGAMYDLQGQGIPVIVPVDQSQVVKAVQTDAKISDNLYTRLGEDTSYLKKSIKAELSRGIATGSSWLDMAQRIAKGMNSPYKRALNNAIRIARTEGHRIQQQSQLDALGEAKKHGADVVKQWDATLDGRTRPEHTEADGQIRELDEYFDVGGEKMKAPGVGGSARNVCNCRCCMLQRARWALDEDETKRLGNTDEMTDTQLAPLADKLGIPVDELRKYSGHIIPVKAKDYEDFRRQYEKIWNYEPVAKWQDSDIIEFESDTLLQTHYNKHMSEFNGISEKEYLAKANTLLRLSQSVVYDDVETLTRSDGSTAIYRVSTNEFLVVTADRNIRTYFKPRDRGVYWDYEKERNKN